MKTCSICKRKKSLAEFNTYKSTRPQSHCRSCFKEYRKLYYLKNRKRFDKKKILRKQKVIAFFKNLKEKSPCTDCKKFYPYYVMEFDHLSNKHFDISQSKNKSLKKIKIEIAKCELVCSNCHRERTHKRRNAIIV